MLKYESFFPYSPFIYSEHFTFFLSSDQIGLTPEEVISKIMANPEVAMAFQNPKVQAAIMDVCSILSKLLVFHIKILNASCCACSVHRIHCIFLNIKMIRRYADTSLTSVLNVFVSS